jgi:3-phosphoshikimate 1-carboxyvinyltransferase
MATFPDVMPIEVLDRPIEAVVRPPGSKSLTNRALVAAALATGGVSRLHGALEADDTEVMRAGLRAFGVMIDDVDDPWLVLGSGEALHEAPGPVDVRASGTTARFLTAVAALVPGTTVVDGTSRMRARPIGPLVGALRMLGVHVEDRAGFPPVTVHGGTVAGGEATVDGSVSSQFVSALLLMAPLAGGPVTVRIEGGTLVSRPYVTSTIEVMRAFGADVSADDPDVFRVAPTGYRPAHHDIEADASAAAYPFVAAAILGGVVAVPGIPRSSTQPDLRLLEVLGDMGCTVHREADHVLLAGPSRTLRAVDADMSGAPDASLALAVACLFADGESTLRGLGTLRVKETDRLAALETEIRRIGGEASVDGDVLRIRPGRLGPARVETYDDHRMAMSFALVGLRHPGIEIVDPSCVTKTWPGYFEMLGTL